MTPITENSVRYEVAAVVVSAATPDFSEVDHITKAGFSFLKVIYFDQIRKMVFIFGKLKHGEVTLRHE